MSFGRKNTPKGQMSGNGSGPAIMMMPPHIRAMFMPDPPLKHLPPARRSRPKTYMDPPKLEQENDNNKNKNKNKSKKIKKEEEEEEGNNDMKDKNTKSSHRLLFPIVKGGLTGISEFLHHMEQTAPPKRSLGPTPKTVKAEKNKKSTQRNETKILPKIESYRKEQRESSGEFDGMNCYNTLFVGRLAYEVTERKLLREFEAFGPVKDLKIVYDTSPENAAGAGAGETKKSRGYAFVEYEQEENMKRAYRAADGMRVEGREVVVDVERGHTVPGWLPRRLGGGLGGTRLGGKNKNVTRPGRFDPSKPDLPSGGGAPGSISSSAPPNGMMNNGGPPHHHHHPHPNNGPGYGGHRGPPPPYGQGGGGGMGHHHHNNQNYHGGGGGGGGRYGPYGGGGGRGGGGGPPPPRGYDRYGGGGGGGGGGGRDYDRYGGGGGGGNDRGMKRHRSRSRSPDRRGRRYRPY